VLGIGITIKGRMLCGEGACTLIYRFVQKGKGTWGFGYIGSCKMG
jgi:hypothetical protein